MRTDLNGRFITHKTDRLDCPKMGANATQKTRSWKSESHQFRQEISRIWWNLKVRYAVFPATGKYTTSKLPWDSTQRIISNLRPTVTSGNMLYGKCRALSAFIQYPGCQTTLCRQSVTANSTYIQLHPTIGGRMLHSKLSTAACRGGKVRLTTRQHKWNPSLIAILTKFVLVNCLRKFPVHDCRKFVMTVINDH